MAINYWNEFFGEDSVAEATSKARHDAFVEFLVAKGMKPSSVSRVISVGKAAIRAAWENGEIDRLLPFKDVEVGEKEPRGRPMSVEEIRRLFAACKHEHLRRFLILLAGTGARPEALLELKWSQIENGCITLNPPGRKQTKKRRPTLKVCDTLSAMIETWREGEHVITWEDDPVSSVKTAWRSLRADAGFDKRVQPTSFRHTLGRWLRANSVPPYEVSAFLGHRLPGMTVTDIYAVADPLYMLASREAVDKLMRAILAPERESIAA